MTWREYHGLTEHSVEAGTHVLDARHKIVVGILVHGDNHFIVRGPLPDREIALALVRHWSLIQIGATTPPSLDRWGISSRGQAPALDYAYRASVVQQVSREHYGAH